MIGSERSRGHVPVRQLGKKYRKMRMCRSTKFPGVWELVSPGVEFQPSRISKYGEVTVPEPSDGRLVTYLILKGSIVPKVKWII